MTTQHCATWPEAVAQIADARPSRSNATEKMRANCRRVRLSAAKKQRRALMVLILSVLDVSERVGTQEIANRVGKKVVTGALRKRLDAMAESGALRKEYVKNEHGLRAIIWEKK